MDTPDTDADWVLIDSPLTALTASTDADSGPDLAAAYNRICDDLSQAEAQALAEMEVQRAENLDREREYEDKIRNLTHTTTGSVNDPSSTLREALHLYRRAATHERKLLQSKQSVLEATIAQLNRLRGCVGRASDGHSPAPFDTCEVLEKACKVKDTVVGLITSRQQRHSQFESSSVPKADAIATLNDAACGTLVSLLNSKRNDINNGIIKYADIDRDICEIQAHVVALVSYTNRVMQSESRPSPPPGDARPSKTRSRRRSQEKQSQVKANSKSGGAAVAVPAPSLCPRKKRHGFVYSTDL